MNKTTETDLSPVIAVRHLTQRYGNGRLIYSDLNFEVPRGRILGLLGKNGTGKTTTINILMGYLRPSSGHCEIFGEPAASLSPATRSRVALLLEGHVQYPFMTIRQIERFYSRFYPDWNSEAYYGLMSLLKVSEGQRLSTMSCGQRSQVALGLIMACNAELLVLDDFSLGLDPGYRRLFVEYLGEYARSGNRTVFMTSHIIQDLERLIDDCIILDYGKILVHTGVDTLLRDFKQFTIDLPEGIALPAKDELFINPSKVGHTLEFHTFLPEDEVAAVISERIPASAATLRRRPMTLEDAFIGLTGKY